MNLFIFKIDRNEIANLTQLKSYYRKAIKQIHPDISGKGSNEFLLIQKQFTEACNYLQTRVINKNSAISINKEQLITKIFDIYVDLMCSSFPQDKTVSFKNKIYTSRIKQINDLANILFVEQNVFNLFQEDLYILRKDTVISNHSFNLTMSLLYNIKDYLLLKHKHGFKYIQNTYPIIYNMLMEQHLSNGLLFINWLVSETIGKEVIRGDLPTTAST